MINVLYYEHWTDKWKHISYISVTHKSTHYFLPIKSQFNPIKNKNVIFSCNHFSCTIFVLISYSFETQIMLVLILIDVQYSQNAVFSFGKFSNRQNHSSSDTHQIPQQCSLLFDTKSGKLLKFQVKKNSNFILKPR